jgi:exodeoxyribonuclease VII large subunit
VDFRARIERALERLLQSSGSRLAALDARLHSLSPLAVLDRGYALVLADDGSLIRSASALSAGDRLLTRLSDGVFTSRVESTEASPAEPAPPKPGKDRKTRK